MTIYTLPTAIYRVSISLLLLLGPTHTGTAAAFKRRSAADLNNYAVTSNNNDFVVGSAGYIYFDGTTK